MSRLLLHAAVTAVTIGFALPALAADSAQNFVDKAAVGGLFEVQSSELALKMSEDAEVKEFAEMMVADHSRANATLKDIAEKEGLKVPAELDKEHAAEMKTLQNAKGQFDPPYVKSQLDGHQATVEMFENYAASGGNAALQNFAKDTLPTLKTHLEKIQAISSEIGIQ
jgi:putative membrane protein